MKLLINKPLSPFNAAVAAAAPFSRSAAVMVTTFPPKLLTSEPETAGSTRDSSAVSMADLMLLKADSPTPYTPPYFVISSTESCNERGCKCVGAKAGNVGGRQ